MYRAVDSLVKSWLQNCVNINQKYFLCIILGFSAFLAQLVQLVFVSQNQPKMALVSNRHGLFRFSTTYNQQDSSYFNKLIKEPI